MTPGALRDWIPAELHAELDAVRPVADRLLTAVPSPFLGILPSHVLAAITERAVAPWLGASLFLATDPVGGIEPRGRGPRLIDEERDWNRNAVLLGDLTRRFGEAMVEPLSALPAALRPPLVTDWLNRGSIDRRIVEAEAAMDRGEIPHAQAALLRLWRETGDPLVADVIDVLDPYGGEPLTPRQAELVFLRPAFAEEGDTLGRALRSGFYAGHRSVEQMIGALGSMPRDPRVGTLLRAALLTASGRVGDLALWADAFGRVADVRGLPRLAWERFLPAVNAAAMWTTPSGPGERDRVRALARRAGGNVAPREGVYREVQAAAWRAGPADRELAAAIYADALRERGDALVPALGCGPVTTEDLVRLPPRTVEALLDRPFGLDPGGAAFMEGVLHTAHYRPPFGVADIDPAWLPVRRLVVPDWDLQVLVALPNLEAVHVWSPTRLGSRALPDVMTEVQAGREALGHPPIRVFGDAHGEFARIPGTHTAALTERRQRWDGAGGMPQDTAVAAVVTRLPTRGLRDVVQRAPAGVTRVTIFDGGDPFDGHETWLAEVDRINQTVEARWWGATAPPAERTSTFCGRLAGTAFRVRVHLPPGAERGADHPGVEMIGGQPAPSARRPR